MSDRDVDAQFADIVAHWDEVAAPRPPRPDQDPDPGPDGRAAAGSEAPETTQPSESSQPGRPTQPPEAGSGAVPLDEIQVWRGAGVERLGTGAGAGRPEDAERPELVGDGDDEEDHFRPGPTAPLPPQEDLHFWGIVVGLVAGPLLLLWLVIFRPQVSAWWTFLALGLTAGGFVLLVLRQPHSRDEDDPDNGARV